MKMNDFKLECYFGLYEFTAPYLLTQSDCESMTAKELLDMEPGAMEGYLGQWLGYTETWGIRNFERPLPAFIKRWSLKIFWSCTVRRRVSLLI